MTWYVRAVDLAAISRGNTYIFIVPGRDPIALDGIDPDAMSRVLTATGLPIAREDLEALCGAATIDRFVELGVLAAGRREELDREPRPSARKRCKRLVVALSGSIRAAWFLPILIDLADGFADEVDVIVSRGARRFVRPRTFTYHGLRVWTDPFAGEHGAAVAHRHLAGADLILVAPASARTIHRLATGECSDLTSLVVAITTAPVVVAPSMNPRMWKHPPIARNVAQLREDGIWVIEPGVGGAAADRSDRGVGGAMIAGEGLFRALDAALTQHAREP